MGVAEAAIAAAARGGRAGLLGQIGEQDLAFLIENLGSGRHFENRIGALAPARFLPMPCMPVAALKCCW